MSWSNGAGTRFPPIDRAARLTVAVDHLTQLLIAARDGDHAALERFIAETQRDVWKMCRYLGDPDTADDLAQETFERAIGSLHRYRADGPARHWILTIARRVCVDSTRRRRRGRRLQRRLADEPTTLSMPSEVAELDDLLAQLDHDRRAAFVTTQVLGLRYDEAADLLDCPIGTIRSRVARARADLVGFLDEPGADRGDGLIGNSRVDADDHDRCERGPDQRVADPRSSSPWRVAGRAVASCRRRAETGRQVANTSGCASCHGADGTGGVGPKFVGLYGSEVTLTDGSTVVADDDYLRRSITDPGAERVEGYAVNMPVTDLSDDEIEAVLAYIRELGTTP